MKKEDYLIKVSHEGEAKVHIRNIGPTDHLTVCGLDGNDLSLEQEVLPLRRGERMDCGMCRVYYENRKGLNLRTEWVAK